MQLEKNSSSELTAFNDWNLKQFEIKYDGNDFDIDQKGLSISDYGIERV
jgi:hypothetical protein